MGELFVNNESFERTLEFFKNSDTAIEIFEKQVLEQRDKVALSLGEINLTYGELNNRANGIGEALRNNNCKPGDIVGVLIGRSIEMVVAILGILKAGCAYMPVDINNPVERNKFIIDHSGTKVILVSKDDEQITKDYGTKVLNVNNIDGKITNLKNINKGRDLAYVIYTSGTTGTPKGVMVENRNLLNSILWHIEDGSNNNETVVLQKSTYVFDVSVAEIFSALLSGGKLQLLTEEENIDFDRLIKIINENKVSHIFFVSTLFTAFIDYIGEHKYQDLTNSIQKIYIGGDPVTDNLLEKYREVFGDDLSKLNNSYGPSECTITATSLNFKDYKGGVISIGHPIKNVEIFILDGDTECKVGETGELCIGGAGVARGYLGNEELTSKVFVKNPYNKGQRIYRTGDLAKLLIDGSYQFIGRIDEQVKVRGYRIELNEIREQILKQDYVDDAVVLAWDNKGNNYLCGYIVVKENSKLDIEDLKYNLSKYLPEYMIPEYFIEIDEIPVTSNGKVDKRNLEKPIFTSKKEFEDAVTEEEKVTVKVFEEILGLSNIGINDNFLELGGDSINAIRMVSKFREYSYETGVQDIMKRKIVKDISKNLKKVRAKEFSNEEVNGIVPLTPIQELFFQSKLKYPEHFNQSFLLETEESINNGLLKRTVSEIIKHHDLLRTVYDDDKQIILPIEESKLFDYLEYDLKEKSMEEIQDFISVTSDREQANLDLKNGPLNKIIVFKTNKISYLLIIIHHLVVDGISWRILIDDLNNVYEDLINNREVILPNKTDSFKEWSNNLKEYRDSHILKKELPYWENISSQLKDLHLIDNNEKEYKGVLKKKLSFSKDITDSLLYEAGNSYNTEINDILITALGRTLKDISKRDSVAIQLEGHGREPIHKEVSIDRTIGWFTIMYPVVLNGIGKTLREDIVNTKETLRRIPNHGLGFGVLASNNPILKEAEVDITFNYLGVFDKEKSTGTFDIKTVEYGLEVSPDNRFGTKINMDGSILDGSLEIVISYASEHYSKDFIDELRMKFKDELENIVKYCSSIENMEETASDKGELNWTDEEYRLVEQKSKEQGFNIEKIYQLTFMQEGILYHKLVDDDSTAYIVQSEYEISPDTDIETLENSFNILGNKYPVLLSNIIYTDVHEPRQVFYSGKNIEFHYTDIEDNMYLTVDKIKRDDLNRGFNLEKDSLYRVYCVKDSNNSLKLVITFHHIIIDGWCSSILLNELSQVYTNLTNGKEIIIDTEEIYSEHEEYMEAVGNRDIDSALEYWEDLLEDYEVEALSIPESNIDSNEEVATKRESVSGEILTELKNICVENGVTLNTIVELAWGTILSRYSNTEDMVFGKVVSGRNLEISNIENMVGLFINTIPVRVMDNDNTVREMLLDIQQQAFNSDRYDYTPLSEIQSLTGYGNNLIQSLIVFENYFSQDDQEAEFKVELKNVREQTNYDITLSITQEESLNFTISYDMSKYSENTIEILLKRLKKFVMEIIDNQDSKIKDIDILMTKEISVLDEFNDTYVDNPLDRISVELFQDIVKINSSNIAVEINEDKLSYSELNSKANYLARELRRKGIGRNDIVAIVFERSIEMIVAILGVLKAGACYLPVDPTNPIDRIEFILKDSEAKVLLTDNDLLCENIDIKNINVDLKNSLEENLSIINEVDDLAYVIYTSGTTGNPKGVMISHRNLVNSISWHIRESKMDSNSVTLQKAAYTFDVSVGEIFSALLSGGKLQLLSSEENDDFDSILNIIKDKSVTNLFMVSTLFSAFIDYAEENKLESYLGSLKRVYLGGDPVTVELVNKFNTVSNGKIEILNNSYGPSECTITATALDFKDYRIGESITIGKPIDNVKLYILQGNRLCGTGMSGELCIGGEGVGKGYLNNEELTKKTFIENPYKEGEIIYRTGDLVRLLDSGEIDFIGRIDEQVKVNGLRIELGEIKSQLSSLSGIRDAAVVVKENNNAKYICAYIINDGNLSKEEVKKELAKTLPEYMIPSYFFNIEEIPTTKNGKLNKKLLPEPEFASSNNYIAPRNKQEKSICDLFGRILEIDEVGIDDNFFEIGGHSLRATRLAAQLNKEFQTHVTIKEIMENKTPRNINTLILNKEKIAYKPIVKATEKLMSSAQKRLYVISQIQKDNITYNIPVLMKLKGYIDIDSLEKAINQLVKRHESLRTGFKLENDEFIQDIYDELKIDLDIKTGNEEKIEDILHDFIRPFDLESAPLMRAEIFKYKEDECIFMMDFHHTIFDGGSVEVLISELTKLYSGEELDDLEIQYVDYSQWHNNEEFKEQEKYWLEEFSEGALEIDMPTDFTRPSQRTFNGDFVQVELNEDIKNKILNLSKNLDTTEYNILLSTFMLLISKFSRNEDVIVGTPVSGRTHPDVENIIGMFVNTLAIKATVNSDLCFREFANNITEKTIDAFGNQDYPFEKLVEKLDGNKDASRNPLFDIMFAFENIEKPSIKFGDVEGELISKREKIAKFDLTLDIDNFDDGYTLVWEFNKDIYREETINSLARYFNEILNNLMDNLETPLSKIDYIPLEERNHILKDFNNTKIDYPKNRNIGELFDEQVKANPSKIAIGFEDERLTYEELNNRANKIASRLIELGVGENEYVGILAEKDINTIPALLGIIKIGAAYLPLDPKNPESRQNYILKDSKSDIVLIPRKDEKYYFDDVKTLELDKLIVEDISTENPKPVGNSSNTAYAMYTSGTTGKPKGVIISQKNIIRLVKNSNYADFADLTVLQTGSLTFDASTFEIWGAILNGGTVYLVNSNVLSDVDLLKEKIDEYEIDTIFLTVALFNQIVSINPNEFDRLNYLLVGGEKMSSKYVRMLKEVNKNTNIANIYGPTESTTFATVYFTGDEVEDDIPIGKPISNTTAYIINNDDELCGIGMPGELYLGGDGLAKGYLNRDDLTKESFVDNPFVNGEIIYKTGDLVKWSEDGNINYLGRIDEQVKIRGFRIELEEISAKILELDEAQEAVTIVHELDNEKIITSYIVENEKISSDKIKVELQKDLPDYMIPRHILPIDSIPLNKNGKVDKRALPIPEYTSYSEYIEPKTQEEKYIAKVFEEILGVEKVGLKENFFELGGDSIKAIRMISKLREWGYEITVEDIIQNRVVEEIGKKLIKRQGDNIFSNAEVVGKLELTPIQKTFYDFNLKDPEYFNQVSLLEAEENIDLDILRRSLDEIVKHHDILRAVFKDGEEEILSYEESKKYDLYEYDLKDSNDYENEIIGISESIQSSISLEEGALVKAVVFKTDNRNYLLMAIHHLVVDGVSWRIIVEDLNNLYGGFKNGEDIKLPIKSSSYKSWSEALREYSNSYKLIKEIPYWTEKEQNIKDGLKFELLEDKDYELKTLKIDFSKENTRDLVHNSMTAYGTEINDLLLTAFSRAIASNFNRDSISLSLEGHGREDIEDNIKIDRTVGWFTSIYPVAFNDIGKSLSEDIINIKESLRQIPNKGIGYGIINTYREELENISPEFTFNFLGEVDEGENNNIFNMSKLESGNEISTLNEFGTPVTINGSITKGILEMYLSFNMKYFEDMNLLTNIADSFKGELEDIISHCVNRKEITKTASDYMEFEWSNDEFEEILIKTRDRDLEIESISPLTPMQEGMLFHKLSNMDSTGYIVQSSFDIVGDFNLEIFKDSIDLLVTKHGVLRSSIIYENVKKARLITYLDKAVEINYHDLSQDEDYEEKLEKIKIDDVKKGFNLEEDSLFRVNIVEIPKGEFKVIMCFHHIIMDGWCVSIILNDIKEFYTRISNGEDIVQLGNEVRDDYSYGDYTRLIDDEDHGKALEYWSELLEEYETAANIPNDDISDSLEYNMQTKDLSMTLEDSKSVGKLSRSQGITVNTIIEGAWGILLQNLNYTDDVVYGKVVSGRNRELEKIEEMVGLFINTIPVRVKNNNSTVEVFLKELQNQAIYSNQYDYTSLSEIQNQSEVGNELIQTLLAFENYYIKDDNSKDSIDFIMDDSREETNYDINLSVVNEDIIKFRIMYNGNKYEEVHIEIILKRLVFILNTMAENPSTKVNELPLIDEDEMKKIAVDFNQNESEYPRDSNIAEMFKEQVLKDPNKVAIKKDSRELTYRELDILSSKLANRLRDLGVKRNDYVTILAEKEVEYIVGVLGIIKAGGAYVALNPNDPPNRLEYIIENCNSKALVTLNEESMDLDIEIAKVNISEFKLENEEEFTIIGEPTDIATLIYTSGTTGEPKGVMIENRSILRLVKNVNYMNLEDIKLIQTASLTFDASSFEIWGPLLNGGTVCLVENDVLTDIDLLREAIEEYDINTIFLTTALFNQLVSIDPSIFNSIDTILSGGEKLSEKHVGILKEVNKKTQFNNLYGPTECTTYALYYPLGDEVPSTVPIGKPVSNTTAYILNGNRLCGFGMPGELCLGGDGLAKGYLNEPELTDEKFIKNPLNSSELIYRTGDLVKMREDGNIDYLGRIDQQVKIRGFRIELDEIANRIKRIDGVDDAVVIIQEISGDDNICAYIESNSEISKEFIRDNLVDCLPSYMIPKYMDIMEKLPWTKNGKIDRKALPKPEAIGVSNYEEPTNETEKILVDIFKDVLNLDIVGINDDFFELGGHSIKVMELVNQIDREFNIRVSFREVMDSKDVRTIAELIDESEIDDSFAPLEIAEEEEL